MRILITGIAGFIGFHLAQKLKSLGHFVIGIDNFNSYYSTKIKRQRAKILQNQQVQILEKDVQESSFLTETFEKYQIAHIVHLAAQAGVRYSFQHPEKYLSSNIGGFLALLEALKNFPQIKTVYASSSSVYGLNEKIPFSTQDRTDLPANFYGVSKKTNELMAYAYHHLYGLNLIGLRFFTVYGPWGRPDMAYFKFTQKIIENQPIRLFNHGKMQRDFTYIDDIINGVIAAIHTDTNFDIFNLGNNQPVEVLSLVQLIEKFLNKKAILKFLPLPKGEVIKTYADISKSQKILNFHPKTSFPTGMEKFLNWHSSWTNIQKKSQASAFSDKSLKTSGKDSIKSEAIKE